MSESGTRKEEEKQSHDQTGMEREITGTRVSGERRQGIQRWKEGNNARGKEGDVGNKGESGRGPNRRKEQGGWSGNLLAGTGL